MIKKLLININLSLIDVINKTIISLEPCMETNTQHAIVIKKLINNSTVLRNTHIVSMRKAGFTNIAIGKIYNLSDERISQIIHNK